MLTRYRFDPDRSRFTVRAFAGGLLSFLGHSPAFAVHSFTGELRFDPGTVEEAGVDVIVRADSLEVVGDVRPGDRKEIEERMKREVLETAAYPEVRYDAGLLDAEAAGGNRHRLRFGGRLSLHGVDALLAVTVDLFLYDDGVRMAGSFPLRLSDFRIRPVTALGGAIRLRDEARAEFDLGAGRVNT
jgi:polyisoprenoid-binding protein YceI